ncbi:diphthamide synthesis protein [Candidatus Woesearchaeota archaeon]|nr:diphthamide synthesis protein [Candidatus Woesearchaeota archaeon]
MKAIFIHAKYKGKIDLEKININELPKKIGVVTTTQFLESAEKITAYLKKNGKQVFVDKIKQRNPGQLLGCDVDAALKIQNGIEAFLYIGSGNFHPLGIAFRTDKNIFCFNPVSGAFFLFDRKEAERYKRNKKANYVKFMHANKIGIMVSIKPGQYSYKKALEIKKKLIEMNKECFMFVFDTLDANEMRNFPFIDFWVNTACPRIADDKDKKNIIDMQELELSFNNFNTAC